MADPRAHADRFLWALAAGALAMALQAPSAEAFQYRPISGLGDLVRAVLALPPHRGEPLPPDDGRQTVGLGALDFDMAGAAGDRALGAGWFGRASGTLEYFTAVGLKFPDPLPVAPEDGEVQPAPLAVGPWAGTGLGWRPTSALRLALEARWTPADLALAGEEGIGGRLQAGATLALRW